MLKQICIFTENKKGAMLNITELLLEDQINILGSVTNDSAEYGIVRMVVSDPQLAYEKLAAKGYQCKVTDIIGVQMNDEVGSLNKLLRSVQESNINVNYLYLSFDRELGKPIILLHVNDSYEVAECLRSKGYDIL